MVWPPNAGQRDSQGRMGAKLRSGPQRSRVAQISAYSKDNIDYESFAASSLRSKTLTQLWSDSLTGVFNACRTFPICGVLMSRRMLGAESRR